MKETNTYKIILKADWDVNINSPLNTKEQAKEQGHFVGREKEVELLTNEILRRPSGSILISGYRGVGKTSLVYKALWEAIKKDHNIIIVILNAAQLEVESDGSEINARKIIENLIKRLYSATRETNVLSKKTKDEIERLYRKAVASEFR